MSALSDKTYPRAFSGEILVVIEKWGKKGEKNSIKKENCFLYLA